MRLVARPVVAVAAVVAAVAVSGCFRGGQGTAVGNPGDADVKARALDPDLVLDEVTVPVSALLGLGCDDGIEVSVPALRELDGLAPSIDPIPLPGLRYCAIALTLSGPIRVRGSAAGGAGFAVDLAVDELRVDAPIDVDGEHLLFDVPLAIDAEGLASAGYTVGTGDPLAEAWADAAANGAELWVDEDLDGFVSVGDARLVEPGDTGFAALQSSGDAGCGCAAPGPGRTGLGALGAAAILASVRRRRALTCRPCPPGPGPARR